MHILIMPSHLSPRGLNFRCFFNVLIWHFSLVRFTAKSRNCYVHLLNPFWEHSWWYPPPQPISTFLLRKTSFLNAGGTSRSVLLAGPFWSSTYPTSLPTSELIESGNPNLRKLFAKAYAATFSLVTIMIWSVGSITSNPAIMAAADSVLPAPNTPQVGIVLASKFCLAGMALLDALALQKMPREKNPRFDSSRGTS